MKSRRDFIRIVASNAVVVAAIAGGLAGCDRMPRVAVEAWNGPATGLVDPRRRALSFAILAPNPHNMQAWLVDLRTPDTVLLHVDPTRLLPMTDPHSRQVMIGQGTFLELLAIAAAESGYRTDITLFPEGPLLDNTISTRPVARVVFARDAAVARDPLFAQIAKRHTTRSPYEDQPLTPAHIAALRGAHTSPEVHYELVQDDRMPALRQVSADAFTTEMTTLRTLKETVDRERVGATEIAEHRDGLAFHGPMMWWARELGIFTPQKALTPGSTVFKAAVDRGVQWSKATPAFGVMTTPDNSRATQVATGRAFVRAHLAATALGVVQQPMSQALQEYPEVAAAQRTLLALLRTPPGHTVQMFYRLGYAQVGEATPRRPLLDMLLPRA